MKTILQRLEAALEIAVIGGVIVVTTVAFAADIPVKPFKEPNQRISPLSGIEILQLRNFLKDVNCSDTPTGCKGIGYAPIEKEK